ncbi:MAG: hypothetical protein AAFP69_00470 [Planctomycetota bacterium]
MARDSLVTGSSSDKPWKVPLGEIEDCQTRLQRQWETFTGHWRESGDAWKDAKRKEFEQTHLQPLMPRLGRLTAALAEFRQAMSDASRQLSDPDCQSE